MNRSHLKGWVLTGSILSGLLFAQSSAAQVIPDATLPVGERSQVSGNPNVQIDGGVRRGGNLFHSFSQFSIPTGESAYFNNAVDVQNIFSRVTGGSISNIDGLIRANGTANLFLLNPNGILFGPNASLNIGGSFVATTATALGLANGDIFSANPGQPLPSQLLNINPNALFFNQMAAQAIVNQSTFNNTGLQVPQRQNLLLVGGPVQLDGGQLISPGSYVELGSVGGVGIVDLSTVQEDWQLNIPGGVTRADALLRNAGDINVKGDGGSIRILAQNIDIFGSTLRIEIPSDSRLPATQTGDIELNATGSITLRDSVLANSLFGQGTMGRLILTAGDRITINGSGLFSTAEPDGVGDIGNVTMTAGTIVFDGSLFVANTSQQTDASNVFINARDAVSFNGSLVFNTVEQTGIGNGGDINITTGSLALTNGAQLISKTSGQGNAGNVNIAARDAVSLDGSGSIILNTLEPTGIGNGGDINITTGSLALTQGSQLVSSTSGQGNAGSVNINAHDAVSLDGSFVFNTVNPTGIGNADGINITTGSLSLTVGSQVNSFTGGRGNAGSVNIQARDTISLDNDSVMFNSVFSDAIGNSGGINITTGSLYLTRLSFLDSETAGQGNAGSVNIQARDTVALDGTFGRSGISTGVNGGVSGQGGDITIATGSLFLINGGIVATQNIGGNGNAGRVTIQARDAVQIRGITPNTATEYSQVVTLANTAISPIGQAAGNGGDVTIATGSLLVSDQGRIVTNVRGQGRAGNIRIQAIDTVSFDGGDAISTLDEEGVGRGGDIDITARSLSVLNNAQLSASTSGDGNAGNITVSADTVGVSSGGQLLTTTSSNGSAGDITVNTPDLQLSGANSGLFAGTNSIGNAGNLTVQPSGDGQSVRVNLQDGAQISASTFNRGKGGELTITAPDSITLTGNGSVIAAGTDASGDGGNLNLRTRNLNIQNQAQVTVSSSGTGSAGNLFVDADRIFLNNQGSIRADTLGGGGNINLRSPLIVLRNGSNITTNATGANIPGGNIGINTRFLVAVPNEDSNISANSEDFRGGNVRINAFSIFGIQPSLVSTPFSDITATGATFALNGTTNVNTAGIDPTSGLVALPTDFVDRSGLIAQGCPANQGNSFVISGRGGLPPTPEQQLDDDANWQDRRRLVANQQVDGGGQGDTETASLLNSPPLPHTPIIEATGWLITPTGEISLVASTPDPTVQNRLKWSGVCSRGESSKQLK
ncbi:filamentous hemagglutinin N-terminal domain-containing protein [Nostoc sp. FACHB-973]|nr:filamentous hemagglutinin N-terminal domain-containing protein [Nostoc sp. FACHB-973]